MMFIYTFLFMFVCLMMFVYTFFIYVCMLNDVYLHIFYTLGYLVLEMDHNRRRNGLGLQNNSWISHFLVDLVW
jgi:hypothetical protein